VTAATHSDEKPCLTRNPHRGHHIRDPRTSRDESRTAVYRTIPYPPALFVGGIARPNNLPSKTSRKSIADRRFNFRLSDHILNLLDEV
jgi:hypothetical protein